MKYVNDRQDDTEETNVSNELSFDKNGKQANGKTKIYAKLFKEEKGLTYLIATHNNEIYDPIGINSNREKYLNMKLKRVSKDTFDFYMIYLQTNNSIYLTRANRRFINE